MIVIGSRGSQLALWQARHIAALLAALGEETRLEIIKTTGWKEHSCRAFLSSVRKTYKLLKEQRPDGKTAYRIEAAQVEVPAE